MGPMCFGHLADMIHIRPMGKHSHREGNHIHLVFDRWF